MDETDPLLVEAKKQLLDLLYDDITKPAKVLDAIEALIEVKLALLMETVADRVDAKRRLNGAPSKPDAPRQTQ